jgi:hypothetical protein
MTYTDDIPPPAVPARVSDTRWDSCDHCQAPLDERQRYCVACGARRAQADDPAARYFVTAARRARSGAAAPVARPASGPGTGIRTALLLALLPVVAAIGIVVGRDGDNGNELLLEALKAQKAPIVNVGGGGSAATAAADDKGAQKKDDGDGGADPADGEVIGRGAYGTARKLTGAKATKEQLEQSKQAIDKIVHSKGKEYVEQQRGLPDQIIVP